MRLATSSNSSNGHISSPPSSADLKKNPDCNIYELLARREICPASKHSSKRFRGANSTSKVDSVKLRSTVAANARQSLISWVEAKSLRHLVAKYCPLSPPPRSTIASAFSPDGQILASTHGDHTVKIIDWQTGKCLKVLSGHRRTPWVVRFHPLQRDILASGSLDHEVRLWDAKNAECIGSRDFFRPIASIAFHAQGDILGVASGHKLYIWPYNRAGESSIPTIILKTRRSLRAVHFHPHAAPFLLTAEVNDLDVSDSSMTRATSPGYHRYPSPTLYLTDGHSLAPTNGDENADNSQQRGDPSSSIRLLTYSTPTGQYELLISPIGPADSPSQEPGPSAMETDIQPDDGGSQFFPFSDPAYWDLPLLQGWLRSQNDVPELRSMGRSRSSVMSAIASGNGNGAPMSIPGRNLRMQSEISNSLAAAAAADLPCTVKLRIWSFDIQDPGAYLHSDKCRLTIPHAVLCSEMGAHFSPCGRYLAACVACVEPNMESDPGYIGLPQTDAATSPTRHPISAHQVMYELRIYSLEEATFGSVLTSRAIRAAHCLTSIQFSPTSEHLLLAYGRRHNSLLKTVFIDGDTTVPVYTILEVYKVGDMELVMVLPSAEDEVNVACFHPSVGNGIVYGTKEGKLRILRCGSSQVLDHTGTSVPNDDFLEVPTYALEG